MLRSCLFLLLGAGILNNCVTGFDISSGCNVTEELEIDPVKFDAVNFHAHIPTSNEANKTSNIFAASLQCSSAREDFDVLTVTDDSISLERSRKGSRTSQNLTTETLAARDGWIDFNLHVIGQYDLHDGKGLSLLSHNVSVDCDVSKIQIKGPSLMRHCYEKKPTWEVKESKDKVIPIPVCKNTSVEDQLILYSRGNFTPKLDIMGFQLFLGWNGDAVEIKETANVKPLPPQEYHLKMYRKCDAHTQIKIMDESRELFSGSRKKDLDYMTVSGGEGADFHLTLFSENSISNAATEATEAHCKMGSQAIGLSAGLGLALFLLILVSSFACCFSRFRSQANIQPKNTNLSKDDDPTYLEPRKMFGSPALPLSLPPTFYKQNHRDEPIYEEVDEVAVKRAMSKKKRKTLAQLQTCSDDDDYESIDGSETTASRKSIEGDQSSEDTELGDSKQNYMNMDLRVVKQDQTHVFSNIKKVGG